MTDTDPRVTAAAEAVCEDWHSMRHRPCGSCRMYAQKVVAALDPKYAERYRPTVDRLTSMVGSYSDSADRLRAELAEARQEVERLRGYQANQAATIRTLRSETAEARARAIAECIAAVDKSYEIGYIDGWGHENTVELLRALAGSDTASAEPTTCTHDEHHQENSGPIYGRKDHGPLELCQAANAACCFDHYDGDAPVTASAEPTAPVMDAHRSGGNLQPMPDPYRQPVTASAEGCEHTEHDTNPNTGTRFGLHKPPGQTARWVPCPVDGAEATTKHLTFKVTDGQRCFSHCAACRAEATTDTAGDA